MQDDNKNNEYNPLLHIQSNKEIPERRIPTTIKNRMNAFFRGLKVMFKKKRTKPNLAQPQINCLQTLKNSSELIVWRSDKNLGPAITERQTYAELALRDHLGDGTTYERLEKQRAEGRLRGALELFDEWINKYKPILEQRDIRFLREKTKLTDINGNYCFPQFYITAKVHKTPLKTRPIISCSGSLFEGFGRWLDNKLQPFGRKCKSFISSSTDLLEKLQKLPKLPPTARLFTCDAVSMYTNILTDHAIEELQHLIPTHIL